MISSRTPEGIPGECPVCGQTLVIEPSLPTRDAPCPHCGCLVWFDEPDSVHVGFAQNDPLEVLDNLEHAAAGRKQLLLDCSGRDIVSSEILGKLLSLHRKAVATGGRLVLCNIDKSIAEVLQITKLDKLLEIR